MSITPNLLNDDCTSLDGWTVEEPTDWEIAGGGFHWFNNASSSNITSLVSFAGLIATIELRTQFTTLGIHDEEHFDLVWAIDVSYLCAVSWCSDGVWMYDPSFTWVKICDNDYSDTMWRVQFDSVNGNIAFYKDGGLINTLSTPVNTFGTPMFEIQKSHTTEGYILPNIKLGDGLGDFGGSTHIPQFIIC
jgi:hypothetical protein